MAWKRWAGAAGALVLATAMSASGCAGSDGSISDGGNGGEGNTVTATGGMGGAGGGCQPAEELCNGVDDNCDGVTDEGCACIEGDTEPCYTGDPDLEGIGACVGGERTCDVDGVFGECEGEGAPSEELCNGIDDDCNGATDEDLGTVTCGLGICQVTVDACVEGVPAQCIPGDPNPAGETCDGTDDNCDGAVDEGCSCTNDDTQLCYTSDPNEIGVGLCAQGTQTCINGQWGTCEGDVTPTTESCDGQDEDCDGTPDDGNPGGGAICNTGNDGICAAGTEMCTGGMVVCEQDNMATTEVCNSLDDDCNGLPDDGNPDGGGACSTGLLGVCAAGTDTCTAGMIVCQQNVMSSPEVCDTLDNDCDGVPDDGNPGGGSMCNTGNDGICAAGTQMCTGGMVVCVQDNMATTEVCNTLDDDCNGLPDDGNPGGGGACSTGLLGVCAAGTDTCTGGMVVCQQNVMSSPEVCDTLDNDCDGVPDDGNPGGGSMCSTGLMGVCAAGTEMCNGGNIVCQQDVMSSMEVCNGLDDDCDGTPDDGNPGGGGACNTGLQGVCAAGTNTCTGGMVVCQQDTASGPEQCNNLDDDCDGVPDDGNPGGGSACNTGLQGICAAGTETCSGGMITCQQDNMAQPAEICGNLLDDDCNGFADDGCMCAMGTYDCDGVGLCECSNGTGCCGTSCQTQHINGQGQTFDDCEALNTYNLTQALKACAAYTGDPVQCTDLGTVCDADNDILSLPDTAVVCADGAADCACWSYSGFAPGYVYNDPVGTTCLCPLVGDPQWN